MDNSDKLNYFIDRTDQRLERIEVDLNELLLHKKYLTGQARGAAIITSILISAISAIFTLFLK